MQIQHKFNIFLIYISNVILDISAIGGTIEVQEIHSAGFVPFFIASESDHTQLDDPCYSYLDFCMDHLSWQWRPHIAGCKMFLTLLRAELAVWTHFFCKMYQWYM